MSRRLQQTGHAILWVVWLLFLAGCFSIVAADAPKPPEPRNHTEIQQVLAKVPKRKLASAPRPINVVLLADVKDHGANAHDYPLWQERWARLLGGSKAWGEGPVNVYGEPTSVPARIFGARGVKVLKAQGWPSEQQFEIADVIVAFCYLNWNSNRIAQVRNYLSSGKGLVVIHAATWTKPRPSAEVGALLGVGGFEKYRHGLVNLKIEKPDHPICVGLPREIQFEDETYWPPTPEPTAPGYTVLASSPEQTKPGTTQPQVVFWTCEPVKGRVFGFILGHFTWTFDDPYARIFLLRGIAWASGTDTYRFDRLVLEGARVK